MKITPVLSGKKYETKIYTIGKTICKIDCLCGDFQFRRKKKVGELADTKYYAEPCKHLKYAVDSLIQLGFKFKKPKAMIGAEKLTSKLRNKLLERANFTCEDSGCGSTEQLEIHRRTRGSNGGKYNMDNCIVLCKACHDARHYNEFPSGKSK
jgi:hypothetical protein